MTRTGHMLNIPGYKAKAEIYSFGLNIQAVYRGDGIVVYGSIEVDIEPAVKFLAIKLMQLEEEGVEGIPSRTEEE